MAGVSLEMRARRSGSSWRWPAANVSSSWATLPAPSSTELSAGWGATQAGLPAWPVSQFRGEPGEGLSRRAMGGVLVRSSATWYDRRYGALGTRVRMKRHYLRWRSKKYYL